MSFENTNDKNYLPLQLDVTSKDSIKKCFGDAKAKFGRLDCVVNNAGYGLCGEFESLDDKQIRQQMEVSRLPSPVDITDNVGELFRSA